MAQGRGSRASGTPRLRCPGCGLVLPSQSALVYDGYFNTSPECWSLFGEVLAAEFGNAVLFSQAHQLSVDTYAVQHAGGPHPAKSIGIHLCGLHLAVDRGLRITAIAPLLQRLADRVDIWPRFDPPTRRGSVTVWNVAMAASPTEHVEAVNAWAREVWADWSFAHRRIEELVVRHLDEGPGADGSIARRKQRLSDAESGTMR